MIYWIEPLIIKYGHSHKAAKVDGSKMLRGKDHKNGYSSGQGDE